jgi:hypothetical protein
MDMMRELKNIEAEKALVLVPSEVFKFDSTPCQTEPETFKVTHKDPEIEERIKKEENQENAKKEKNNKNSKKRRISARQGPCGP